MHEQDEVPMWLATRVRLIKLLIPRNIECSVSELLEVGAQA